METVHVLLSHLVPARSFAAWGDDFTRLLRAPAGELLIEAIRPAPSGPFAAVVSLRITLVSPSEPGGALRTWAATIDVVRRLSEVQDGCGSVVRDVRTGHRWLYVVTSFSADGGTASLQPVWAKQGSTLALDAERRCAALHFGRVLDRLIQRGRWIAHLVRPRNVL